MGKPLVTENAALVTLFWELDPKHRQEDENGRPYAVLDGDSVRINAKSRAVLTEEDNGTFRVTIQ